MAGGPRLEPIVHIWEHDCDCDMCTYDQLNIEVDYRATCCVGYFARRDGAMGAKMELSEHLLHEHGIQQYWEKIPAPKVDYCHKCGGESAIHYRRYRDNPCPECNNKGWLTY